MATTVRETPSFHDMNRAVPSSGRFAGRTVLGREVDRWSARNSSKGASLVETIQSLQFLAAGHPVEELHRAIQEEDLLGKRTWEARRTYWRLISWRFLTPPDSPVVAALAALARHGSDDPVLWGALYFHFCLADRLTFDVGTDLLWTLQEEGREFVNATEVENYIRGRSEEHPEVLTWSSSTLDKLGSSLLSAFRDFGRLSGASKKRLAQPALPDDLLVYVCRFLRDEGASARDIVGAPEFRLWGRGPHDIGRHLAGLSRAGALRFEWSGNVAILDLGDETFDAFARRIGQEVR